MTLPRENSWAFFPRPILVSGRGGVIPREFSGCGGVAPRVTLLPLTLAGAVRLSELSLDISRPLEGESLYLAAYVLSGEELPFPRFLRRARRVRKSLSTAVERQLNAAFATYVKPSCSRGAGNSRGAGASSPASSPASPIHLTPHGLGWALELAEFLCAEYGWSFETAAATPVARAYALAAAARQRRGEPHAGLDYLERAYAESLKKHG